MSEVKLDNPDLPSQRLCCHDDQFRHAIISLAERERSTCRREVMQFTHNFYSDVYPYSTLIKHGTAFIDLMQSCAFREEASRPGSGLLALVIPPQSLDSV